MRIRIITAVLLLAGCQQSAHNTALVETRLQLGLAYLSRGELGAASRNLQRALALAPNDYRTQLAQARFLHQSGNDAQAEQHYRRALRLAPENGDVLNNYGAFLCRLRQYDAAQRYFRLAARGQEHEVRIDSAENAGYCYLSAGQAENATRALSEALSADPARGVQLLAEAERRFGKGRRDESRLLLDIYQHSFPVTAESLWLEIRFAVQEGRSADIQDYGGQLARNFPLSIQYQQFLANEY